ncbi:hypothetical protein EDC04DRAFT_2915988 [Pisolithus marmoratus]|nr:hypothetical protein EDC04DRAFT_2915988 [Pisolithus marmoratus]
MSSQFMPMGIGAFDVALDINMLKDAIVNHWCQCKIILASHADGGMTPGQVAMTPYDTNSPAWSESSFKGKLAASLAVNGGEDPTNFSFLGYGQSPLGAGGMSPTSLGYSLSSPIAYLPTSASVSQCPQNIPWHRPLSTLTSPGYSPTSLRYLPMSPSFSPTSPCYSPQSPSFSPASPRYSPISPSFSSYPIDIHLVWHHIMSRAFN